jgi:hypothetical protein
MLSYADSVIKRAVLLGSSVLQVVCEDGGEINYGFFRFGVLACKVSPLWRFFSLFFSMQGVYLFLSAASARQTG